MVIPKAHYGHKSYIYRAKIQKQLMIASIFNKSKPINFVIVIGITILAFVFSILNYTSDALSVGLITKEVATLLISIFTVFLLNFIVIKNKLIEQSSYHILLYCLFLAMFPVTLISSKELLSNVFILLALRRIISMRSQINVKKKLFDASFWIAIATLFHFWAILFFVLIFVALFLFSDNRIKNWIVPFTGIFAVFVLMVSYHLLRYDTIEGLFSYLPRFNFDFNNYNSIKLIVACTLLLSFGIWSTIFYVKKINSTLKMFRPSHKIIIAAVILALGVVLLSEEKTSGEFIFLFAPISIIMTNYIEIIEENWFKEVFLTVLVLAPIVLLFL